MGNLTLLIGEKYLTISLFGKDGIRISAFKNKDRKDKEPHYRGDGVAVWINEKKAEGSKPNNNNGL